MSALSNCVSRNGKTTSVEGRHCIFSKHPVSEHPLGTIFSDEQLIVGGYVDKAVKGTVD